MGYLLYTTDANHSHQSKQLIGVFDKSLRDIELTIQEIVKKKSLEEFESKGYENAMQMYNDEMSNFHMIFQTQGFSENFVLEEIVFNQILKSYVQN